MDKLQEHISNSPLVRAAIVESVHRFYFDRCLSNNKQDMADLVETNVSNVLSKLWNLHPNWRHDLLTIPTRYRDAFTNVLPADGKHKMQEDFIVSEIIFK